MSIREIINEIHQMSFEELVLVEDEIIRLRIEKYHDNLLRESDEIDRLIEGSEPLPIESINDAVENLNKLLS
jgi:hypothetical protein